MYSKIKKIVLHIRILKFLILTPQVHQIFKPIRKISCAFYTNFVATKDLSFDIYLKKMNTIKLLDFSLRFSLYHSQKLIVAIERWPVPNRLGPHCEWLMSTLRVADGTRTPAEECFQLHQTFKPIIKFFCTFLYHCYCYPRPPPLA